MRTQTTTATAEQVAVLEASGGEDITHQFGLLAGECLFIRTPGVAEWNIPAGVICVQPDGEYGEVARRDVLISD